MAKKTKSTISRTKAAPKTVAVKPEAEILFLKSVIVARDAQIVALRDLLAEANPGVWAALKRWYSHQGV